MELYFSGVSIPRLGSIKDFVLRDYLVKQARKEVHKNQLMAYSAMAMAALVKSKELQGAILKTWNDYLNLEMFMEGQKEQEELDMREEYEFWKSVKPKLNIGKDGSVSVSGIPMEDARSRPTKPKR